MASLTTYPLLKAAIIDICEDDSIEFADYIPTAVNLAEDRLFRELKINYSVVTDSYSCTTGDQLVDKPSDLRATTGLFVIVSGQKIPLVKRGDEFCSDYWPDDSVRDVPKYYAERDITKWRLVPTPNNNYPLHIQYEAKPAYLDEVSNTSNIYTERYPDLLFYTTMVNMCEWMKDTDRKQEWEARYIEAVNTVNNEGLRNSKEDNATKV